MDMDGRWSIVNVIKLYFVDLVVITSGVIVVWMILPSIAYHLFKLLRGVHYITLT